MKQNQIEYVVFCIENLAIELKMPPPMIYEILTEKTDILQSYIIPCYDTLHTQGKKYIINDIIDVIKSRGMICEYEFGNYFLAY